MTDQRADRLGSEPVETGAVSARMESLRNQIDRLDEQIVKLLNERAENALELGVLKSNAGMETYQPDREIAVLEHARAVNAGPLEGDAITRLFERIIDEHRRLERLSEGDDS